MEEFEKLALLSNDELIKRLIALNATEHEATIQVVLHLIEVQRRELYLTLGYQNLFSYCTEKLGYSEPGTYRRITGAKAIKEHPELFGMLKSKEVSLTTISLIYGVLTQENKAELLSKVKFASRSEVEQVVASYRAPKAPIRDEIKPIVERRVVKSESNESSLFSPVPPSFTCEKAPEAVIPDPDPSYRVQFAASPKFMKKLQRIRELRGKDSLEEIFEAAMDSYLTKHDPVAREARRSKRTESALKSPKSSNSRYISLPVRDQVMKRDNYCCSFEGLDGKRCGAKVNLEIDHKVPFAKGGTSSGDNLRVLCAEHNRHAANLQFGKEFMLQFTA